MGPIKPDTAFDEEVTGAATSVGRKIVRKIEQNRRKAAKTKRKTREVITGVRSTRRRPTMKIERSHPKEGAEIGQNTPMERSPLHINPDVMASKTTEAATDVSPVLILRNRNWK